MMRQSKTVIKEAVDNNRWLRWLIILVFLIVLTWVVGQVGGFMLQYLDTFLLFFIAWLLAFTLRPVAEALKDMPVPRRDRPLGATAAVNLVYVGVLLLLALLGLLIMPPLVDQINNLIAFLNNPKQLGDFQNWALDQLSRYGIKPADLQNFINTLTAQAADFTKQVLGFLQGIFSLIFNIVIILILSYIFLSDGKRIADSLRNIVPMRYRDQTRLLGGSIENSFGGFLRGQFLIGLFYGSMVGIVMAIFKLNFALLAAIVTALFMLVPLIGYVAAYVPPVLIAFIDSISDKPISWAGSASWWIILIIVVVVQAVILNIIAPKVMSQSVGVHPLVVFGAMLLGSKVGGVWGALFGIPIAGVINVMAGQFFNSFIKPSAWFNARPSGWEVVESIEEQSKVEIDAEEAGAPGEPPAPATGGIITISDPSGDDRIVRATRPPVAPPTTPPHNGASADIVPPLKDTSRNEEGEPAGIGVRK
jgi:predicted PurR-regulated permease PerM